MSRMKRKAPTKRKGVKKKAVRKYSNGGMVKKKAVKKKAVKKPSAQGTRNKYDAYLDSL